MGVDPFVVYADARRANRAMFEAEFGTTFSVLTFATGRDALQALATQPVVVLIADATLAEMDGDELMRGARKLSPTTIRIALTTYAEVEALTLGTTERLAARYVVKPWDRREMRRLIDWAIAAHDSDEPLVGIEPEIH
jgi:response regulator RpfG family c-di-GMP phosphodiesterase